MFHALTLIAALTIETEARLAIDAGREIDVGLASFVLCKCETCHAPASRYGSRAVGYIGPALDIY
jgi:hypothetical protein